MCHGQGCRYIGDGRPPTFNDGILISWGPIFTPTKLGWWVAIPYYMEVMGVDRPWHKWYYISMVVEMVPLKVVGRWHSPSSNWQEKYHLYTTYSPYISIRWSRGLWWTHPSGMPQGERWGAPRILPEFPFITTRMTSLFQVGPKSPVINGVMYDPYKYRVKFHPRETHLLFMFGHLYGWNNSIYNDLRDPPSMINPCKLFYDLGFV